MCNLNRNTLTTNIKHITALRSINKHVCINGEAVFASVLCLSCQVNFIYIVLVTMQHSVALFNLQSRAVKYAQP